MWNFLRLLSINKALEHTHFGTPYKIKFRQEAEEYGQIVEHCEKSPPP